MTSDEIKKAMHEFAPVVYDDNEYMRITAYIYRVIAGRRRGTYKTIMQCELLDYNGNSVTIANAEKVRLKNGRIDID